MYYKREGINNMKKIVALLLVFVMMFALCSCGGDKETGAKEEKPASAKIAIEDFEVTDVEDGYLEFKVKVRNISENNLEFIEFDYQVLDENGDILCYQTLGATNVSAGQAIWAGTYGIRDINVDEAASICFVSDALPGLANTPIEGKVVFNLDDYM